MRRIAPLFLFGLLVCGTGAAHAQNAVAPAAPLTSATSGQPGVDINSTLYPRPPASNTTQPGLDIYGRPASDASAQPVGISADRFIWYPAVTGGAFYDDNVFARSNNRQGDWASFVRPELAWRSNNWTNMEVTGSAFVEQRWYDRFSGENQFNGGATVGGTLTPGENTQVVTRLSYVHGHEDRGTSDSINNTFTRPLQYDQLDAAGAINQRFDRMWTSVGAAAAFIHFNDGSVAGTAVSQDYRNGVIARAPFRLGYVIAPLTSVFVEVSANQRNFRVDSFDSSGYRVVGGMLFEPGPGSRIKGEVFGGYMNQDYSGAGFNTVSTWTVGSSLAYLLTPTLTASLETRRDAREASLSAGQFVGTPGDGVSVIETVVAGRLDWAVRPNLVVGAGLAYLQDDYLGANRSDRALSPLFSVKYFPNPYLTLGFDYRHLNFDTDGLGVSGYYRNVYLLSASLKM